MKKILIPIFFILSSFGASAQTWSRIYSTAITDAVQCYDSGIALSAAAGLLKMDVNGNILWYSHIKDSLAVCTSLDTTSDGGFIIAGFEYGTLGSGLPVTNFIIKFNACGQQEWTRLIPQYGYGQGIGVFTIKKNRGYIAAISAFADYGDLLCRLDSNGKPLWSILFQIDPINDILVEEDGSFLITGRNKSITKISSAGKVLWVYNYNFSPNLKYTGYIINSVTCQTKDKGYLTSLNEGFASSDSVAVLKLDSNGNEEWVKKTGDEGIFDDLDLIYDSSDNTYILFEPLNSALSNYSSQDSIRLVKLDSNAGIMESKKYGYHDVDGLVIHTYDGQYLFAGDILLNKAYNTHLWKFNSNLEQDSFDDSSHFVYDYKCKTKIADTISLAGADTAVIDTNTMTIVQDSSVIIRNGISAIKPLPSSPKISIYPNPAFTSLNIASSNFIHSIIIYDATGRIITLSNVLDYEKIINVSINSLPSGIYIIKATFDNGNYITKFIKQ